MAMKLGAISSLQKPFKPAALLAAVRACLERARGFIGLRRTHERCCFRPVMRNSIRLARPARRAESGRTCEHQNDARNEACHRDGSVGRDRGFRGRLAELSQPGTGAAAARPRPHRDAFAAGGDRPRILRGERNRRCRGLSFHSGAARIDPRPQGGRHRSDRRRLRKDVARPARFKFRGRTRRQARLCDASGHRP